MADLPDLDSGSISTIAYFNAIENTSLNNLNPSDLISASGVVSTTAYDNGLDGVWTDNTAREFNFRLKEDGWMVVWLDRTRGTGTKKDSSSGLFGWWDMVNWANDNSDLSLGATDPNEFQNAIEKLLAEHPNWATVSNYNSDDIGYFHYKYSSTTTYTLLSYTDPTSYDSGKTMDWLVTDTTALGELLITGAVGTADYTNEIDVEGIVVATSNQTDWNRGVYDALDAGWVNSNTSYSVNTSRGGSLGPVIAGVHAIWE